MMAEQKTTKKTFKSTFSNPLKQKDNEERNSPNVTTEKNPHFQEEGKIKKSGTLHDKNKINIAGNTTKKDNAGVKKRTMTSLTDDQYEDIFTSAIKRVLTQKFPSPEETGSDEEIEDKAAVPEPNKAQSPHEGAKEPKETGIAVKSSKKQNMKKQYTNRETTSIKKQDSVPKKCPVLKRTMPFLPMQKKTQEASINTKQIKCKTNYEAEQSEQVVSSSQTQSSQNSHSGPSCKKHSNAKQHNRSQEGSHSQQNSQSQCSPLPFSQPDPHLTLKERLFWLQQRRNVGLWVQCSRPICNKWRYLKDVRDPVDVPHEWFCHMNSDKKYNSCSAPEKPPSAIQEEDLIHNLYTAGSIVWGRLDGYPWWPAMVDDCPDTEQYYWLNGFSDIPTHYNLVFFDEKEVTRSWLTPGKIKPFHGTETSREFRKTTANGIDYGKRIQGAKQQAMEALPMTISERLRLFSFISRHKGPFGTLKSKPVHSKKRKRCKESEEEVFGNKKHKETNQVAQKSCKGTVSSAATYNGNKSDSSYGEIERYPETEMSKVSDANKSPKMFHFSNSLLYTQEIDSQEIRSKGANHKSKMNQTLEYRELSSSDEELGFTHQIDKINSSQDLFQSEEEGEKGDENDGSKGVNENCNTSLIVRHEPNENIKTIEVETSSSLIKVSNTENDSTRAVIGRSKLKSSKEEMDDHQLPSASSVIIMDGTMEDDSTRVVVGRNKPLHEIKKTKEESDSLPMKSSLINILVGERNKQDEIVIVQEPGSSVAPTNETAFIETEEKDTAPPLLPKINNASPNNNKSLTPPQKKTRDAINNENGITQDTKITSNGYSHSVETEAIQNARGNSQVCTEQLCNVNSNVRDVEAQPLYGNRADSSNSYIDSSSSQAAETFPTTHNENLNSEQGQSTDNTMSTIFHIDSGNIQGGQISIIVSNVNEQTSSSAGIPIVPNSQNNRIQRTRSQNSDAVVPQLSVDEDSDDFEVEE